MMPSKNHTGADWQAMRRQILTRDAGVCQIRGPKCKVSATEVDHIVAGYIKLVTTTTTVA